MDHIDRDVKKAAPLSNVMRAATAMQSALDRDPEMPGLLCLHGHSGLGKSKTALYLAIKYRAYHVEAESYWTLRDYMEAILEVMGIVPERTISRMAAQVKKQLSASGRPLIIDEAEYLLDRGWRCVMAFKDIFEKSRVPVMLIGEHTFPQKLEKHYDKVHNRILHWIEAQPCTLADCRMLAERRMSGIAIADDLLEHIHKEVYGNTRRVSNNLFLIRELAEKAQRDSVDLEWWGDRPIEKGRAPTRSKR